MFDDTLYILYGLLGLDSNFWFEHIVLFAERCFPFSLLLLTSRGLESEPWDPESWLDPDPWWRLL